MCLFSAVATNSYAASSESINLKLVWGKETGRSRMFSLKFFQLQTLNLIFFWWVILRLFETGKKSWVGVFCFHNFFDICQTRRCTAHTCTHTNSHMLVLTHPLSHAHILTFTHSHAHTCSRTQTLIRLENNDRFKAHHFLVIFLLLLFVLLCLNEEHF